jgi:hypothetical protein
MTPEPTTTVSDGLGRQLDIRKLTILEEMDLLEMAGEAASNTRWMLMATIASTVRTIDGVPRPLPTNRKLLRAQMTAVGSEGLSAAISALGADVPEDADTDVDDGTLGRHVAIAKNSVGTQG